MRPGIPDAPTCGSPWRRCFNEAQAMRPGIPATQAILKENIHPGFNEAQAMRPGILEIETVMSILHGELQ